MNPPKPLENLIYGAVIFGPMMIAGLCAWPFPGLSALAVALVTYFTLNLTLARLITMTLNLQQQTFRAEENSRAFLAWKVYGVVNTFGAQYLLHSGLVPWPWRAPFYRYVGAKVGRHVLLAGRLWEPLLISIGDGAVLGEDCFISGHYLVRDRVEYAPVRIGARAIIGARATLGPGVVVGDGAVIAASAVVLPHTKIEAGEFWAGNPAVRKSSAKKSDTAA